MATHSSILAWKIPWVEEPGRLRSVGLQRVRCDWATSLFFFFGVCYQLGSQSSSALLSPSCPLGLSHSLVTDDPGYTGSYPVSSKFSKLDYELLVGDTICLRVPEVPRQCHFESWSSIYSRQCVGFSSLRAVFLKVWLLYSRTEWLWVLVKHSVSWAPSQTYWIYLFGLRPRNLHGEQASPGDFYIYKNLRLLLLQVLQGENAIYLSIYIHIYITWWLYICAYFLYVKLRDPELTEISRIRNWYFQLGMGVVCPGEKSLKRHDDKIIIWFILGKNPLVLMT